MNTNKQYQRLNYLDSLRGIAILLVVLYHYYYRFQDEGYYYFSPINIPLIDLILSHGYAGVHLFFVISGFVITMTLFKSSNCYEFIIRRFSRLWPTMLLCSILTYFYLLSYGMIFETSVWKFLPSLSFTDPYIFNRIFDSEKFGWIDGAYWSLFVEIRFYLLVAIIYFNTRNFAKSFLFFSYLLYISKSILIDKQLIFMLELLFFTEYLYLFILGIGFYFLHTKNKTNAILYCTSSIVFLILNNSNNYEEFNVLIFLIIFITFILLNFFKSIRSLISIPLLSNIGVASYSLYLIHQNIGVDFNFKISNIIKLNNYQATVLLLITLIIMIFLSKKIFTHYETPLNIIFLKKLLPNKNKMSFLKSTINNQQEN